MEYEWVIYSSIESDDWKKEKTIAKQIAGLKSFGVKGIQAGAVMFDDSASLVIPISKSKTFKAFETSLDNIVQSNGYTDILNGLETALTKMFSQGNGMRSDSKKVAFLFTDGKDDSQDSSYMAMKNKFLNRQILLKVIGVGNVNEQHLKYLVKQESDFVHGSDLDQFLNADGSEVFDVDDFC